MLKPGRNDGVKSLMQVVPDFFAHLPSESLVMNLRRSAKTCVVRKSVTIDWTLREGARAKIGSLAAAARSAYGLCFAQPVSVAPLLRLA